MGVVQVVEKLLNEASDCSSVSRSLSLILSVPELHLGTAQSPELNT